MTAEAADSTMTIHTGDQTMTEATATRAPDYDAFLKTKAVTDAASGFEPPSINEMLFPFQRDIVRWACRRGRAAIFANCGLGKTPMQLEWARLICDKTCGKVLILAPLAVSAQTVREGEKFGVHVTPCRDSSDVREGVNVTNYERMEAFSPSDFSGIVLDESSILKAYDGKTRTAIIEEFGSVPYRLACTATPAPNDFMELGNHSEFLGSMSRSEMLSMFFVHDGGETQKWRVRGHAKGEFWKWVCSWAVMLRSPSDLGYSDDDFILPPLHIRESVVESAFVADGALFHFESPTLQDRIRARRVSVDARVKRTAEIVRESNADGPWLIWCNLNSESAACTKLIDGAVEVRGSDPPQVKEDRLLAFSRGEIRCMVTKPSIAGFGLNLQVCPNVVFLGLSDSWEQYYQAVRRCWRFGQEREVTVHIVTSDAEGAVVENIKRKERDAKIMASEMVGNMSEINQKDIHGTQRSVSEYRRDSETGDGWTLHLGDCVDAVSQMDDGSIDYTIFSPPFSSLYTYSNSDRDMGNSRSDDQFMEHFGFLVREMFRATKPGRLISFHCMNLPTSKTHHGYIGIRDFRGELIRMFEGHGWIFHSEVCIWKDPVTAMQRTKALGLLWKQIKKDSAMSRQGIPDYLVTMRKPGVNPDPVSHTAEEFPVAAWQRYASPVWMDINPSDTIQFRSAREHNDERHICPLQLEVIRRGINLWSSVGDLVLSPFAGIGSEGHVAVTMDRKFIGVELKESYWKQACKNLRAAEVQAKSGSLFG